MKKYLVLILVLILSIIGCKKNEGVDIKSLDERDGVYYSLEDNSLFKGKAFLKNEDGKIILEADFVEGILHGNFKKYDDYGVIKVENNYIYGNLDGECKEYYYSEPDVKKNVLKSIANYSHGLLNGEIKMYSMDGKIFLEGNYVEGKLDGEIKQYYDTSLESERIEEDLIASICNYKNGEIQDEIRYYPDGTVYKKKSYKN